MKRAAQLSQELGEALNRLLEALKEAESMLEIDGTIQRFEFTFELLWKMLKLYLEDQGIQCWSPKSCLTEAYRANLIESETAWLSMLDDRNLSVHLYDFEMSRKIFQRIRESYVSEIQKLVAKFQE